MSKHTPGPWTAITGRNRYPGIDGLDYSIIIFGWIDKGEELGIHGNCPEEGEANANLIAAAPEMYEALQCAEDYKKYADCRDEDEQSAIEEKWLSTHGHMLPESQRHRLSRWQFACLIGVMRQAALKKAEGDST